MNRKKIRNILLLTGIMNALWAPYIGGQPHAEPPNVLFIAIDDMNDWIGPLANHLPRAMTPNLDRLARKGVTFTNAHCAGPVCHPSRVSVMTGRYPQRANVNMWPSTSLITQSRQTRSTMNATRS